MAELAAQSCAPVRYISRFNRHCSTSNALRLPLTAAESTSVRVKVESLADLLACINSQSSSQTPMLRTTVGKIAAFIGKSVDEISLDMIHTCREGFRPYLEGQRYKEGSIRSYVNYLRMLMDTAEKLGWKPFARFRTISGYFDNFIKLADAIEEHSGDYEGIYVSLNSVNPALLARANKHAKEYAQATTTDRDIVRRAWLLIDIDPVRPAGVSSSDLEKEAARVKARAVRAWLAGAVGRRLRQWLPLAVPD